MGALTAMTPSIDALAMNWDPTAGPTQTSKVVPVPNCSLLEEDVREAIIPTCISSWILWVNKSLPKILICFCKAETANLFVFPPSPPNHVALNIYRDLYTV